MTSGILFGPYWEREGGNHFLNYMTIDLFADTLRQSLNEKLTDFKPESDDLFQLGRLLNVVRDAIQELKSFVNTYHFTDEREEIRFFREIKPGFISEYFYYKKLFALRLFDSFRDDKARLANYQIELKKLEQHAARNRDFYQYCLTASTDLDRQYFLRGRRDLDALDRDEKFSTGFDTRLARMLANDLIRKFIHRKLQESVHGQLTFELTWTESKTALIELVYALHAAQVFNNGTADIRPIAATFETCFNISLGNYYRIFQDVRLRKGNATSFLDQLRKALQNHINAHNS